MRDEFMYAFLSDVVVEVNREVSLHIGNDFAVALVVIPSDHVESHISAVVADAPNCFEELVKALVPADSGDRDKAGDALVRGVRLEAVELEIYPRPRHQCGLLSNDGEITKGLQVGGVLEEHLVSFAEGKPLQVSADLLQEPG